MELLPDVCLLPLTISCGELHNLGLRHLELGLDLCIDEAREDGGVDTRGWGWGVACSKTQNESAIGREESLNIQIPLTTAFAHIMQDYGCGTSYSFNTLSCPS